LQNTLALGPSNIFGHISRAVVLLGKVLATTAGAIILALVIVTVVSVVMRYFFRSPITWVYELSESALLLGGCLSWAYAQQKKQHVAVDFIVTRFPKKAQNILAVVDLIVFLLFCGILIWSSLSLGLTWSSRGVSSAELHIPLYVMLYMLALGACGIVLQILVDLKEATSRVKNPEKK
jgi:TRAP-type C4-dicarboxylate transport system permease small subunit